MKLSHNEQGQWTGKTRDGSRNLLQLAVEHSTGRCVFNRESTSRLSHLFVRHSLRFLVIGKIDTMTNKNHPLIRALIASN